MNKKLLSLLEAIDDYELYSKSQREVLKILVNIAIDDIAVISVKYIIEKTGITRSTAYNILKNLQNNDIIIKVRLKNTRQDSYKLNEDKLHHIVNLYNNKRALK